MIKAKDTLEVIQLGHSIAVEGVCLTVTDFNDSSFCVGLAPETCARTHLKNAKAGTLVNLERAVLPATRLGGHYVQGHVDTTAKINKISVIDKTWLIKLTHENKKLNRSLIEKASISVNGVSLTISKVQKNYFEINVIPHTLKLTNLRNLKINSLVNIEIDIFSKYILKISK